MYNLTEEGKKYLEQGLPEKRLIELLRKGKISFAEAQKSINEFSIALQWAKKNGWIAVAGNEIRLVKEPQSFPEQDALAKVSRSGNIESTILSVLLSRKLVTEDREDLQRKAEKSVGKEIANLTEELIKTGLWRKVKLKQYNVTATGKKLFPGRKQHYAAFLDHIRQKMVSLGFKEMAGPLVETEFWNMDALFMPQHHSARDIHDAYFVKEPAYAKSLDKKILDAVRKSHESGTSESRGWEYQYDLKRAHRHILRTHDTSISPRTLASPQLKIPGKYFQIARCFRYDVIDATHLPEFNQVGGFVVEEGINLRHLFGLLKLFANEFSDTDKIKIVPAYFPFTEPSAALYAKHPEMGWIELGGAGVFREEMTTPLGISTPVIAWGLGIDRIGMFNMGVKDIRDLFSTDLKYLREIKVTY